MNNFLEIEHGVPVIDELEIDYRYKVDLVRVIDGDTYDFNVDLGFRTFQKIRVRLKGFDTPELRGEEREDGLRVKAVVEKWMAGARQIVVDTYKTGKYGRWIGDVYLDGVDLKQILKGVC